MDKSLSEPLAKNRSGLIRVSVTPKCEAVRLSWWTQFGNVLRRMFGTEQELVADVAALKDAALKGGRGFLCYSATKNAKLEAEIVREYAAIDRELALTGPDAQLKIAEAQRMRAEAEKLSAEARQVTTETILRTIAALKEAGFDVHPVIEANGAIGIAICDVRGARTLQSGVPVPLRPESTGTE